MNAIFLTLSILGGLNQYVQPRQFRVAVVFCEGDPLGSKADGNVKHLAEPVVITRDGRPAFMRSGAEVRVAGAGGKAQKVWVGTQLEVLPIAYPNGNVFVDVTAVRSEVNVGLGIAGAPGFTERSMRVTRMVKSGEKFRLRLAADAPDDQMWAEVTVTEVSRGK